MFKIILLSALSIAAVQAQSDTYCDFILRRDCSKDPREEVCGTNNVTYRNRCLYAKDYCRNKSIHIKEAGACSNQPATSATTAGPVVTNTVSLKPVTSRPTTMMPVTTMKPINGSLIVLDIFCLDLNYVTCQTGGNQICGSDGKFYDNACEFDKERCFHRDLEPSTGCS